MGVLGVNLVILFDKRVRYVKNVMNHCPSASCNLLDCCFCLLRHCSLDSSICLVLSIVAFSNTSG